jgi:phosphoribosylanthranilate isomerase
MTWIKICGTTNLEDAQLAVEAGADALGFVFYDKSPRNIDPDAAREIVAQLPPNVETVGVFVDQLSDHTIEIFNHARLTAMQFHLRFDHFGASNEGKAYGAGCFWQMPKHYISLPMTWFFAEDEEHRLEALTADFSRLGAKKNFPAGLRLRDFGTFFLDSSTPEQPGGTGVPFDWKKAVPLVESMRENVDVVVAGGLTPSNVPEAIRILKPWGVDVASGVESKPGKKDPEKVYAFVRAVREAGKVI